MPQLSKGAAPTYNALGDGITDIADLARAIARDRHEPRAVAQHADSLLDLCRELDRVIHVDLRVLLERRSSAPATLPADELADIRARLLRLEHELVSGAQNSTEAAGANPTT